MSARDDDRLVDGRRIADVIAEDERQRQREQAQRDEDQFERYMSASFAPAIAPATPPKRSKPHPDGDPDLHAGPRAPASSADDEAFEAYMAHFPGA